MNNVKLEENHRYIIRIPWWDEEETVADFLGGKFYPVETARGPYAPHVVNILRRADDGTNDSQGHSAPAQPQAMRRAPRMAR